MIKAINPIKREWLKKLRKDQEMKTREVADLFGVSFQHYNDIENGRRNPSIELAVQIADFFDFPVDKFFKERTKFKKTEE